MKQRRVVVEVVAVLDEACCPSPSDVQMLRLVGVEAVMEERDAAQNERDGGARREREAFGTCQG